MTGSRSSPRTVRVLLCAIAFASSFAACAHKPTGKPTAPAPEYEPPRQWAAPSAGSAAPSKQKELPID